MLISAVFFRIEIRLFLRLADRKRSESEIDRYDQSDRGTRKAAPGKKYR